MFTEDFIQLNLLQSLTSMLLEDCQWYLGYVHVFFMDKYGQLTPLIDPGNFEKIDAKKQDFVFNANETRYAYTRTILRAIQKMPKAQPGNGRYIFGITDFDQEFAGHQSEVVALIDNELQAKGILMRNFRLDLPAAGLEPSTLLLVDTHARAQANNIVRLHLRGTSSVVDSVRPCRPLSAEQKLAGLTYEKRFHLRYMILNHPSEFYTGLVFFILAIVAAIGAMIYRKIQKRRIEYRNMA